MSDPKVYLSTAAGKWRVINQGMPMTADKASAREAWLAIPAEWRMRVSVRVWDGDAGDWTSSPL